MCDKGFPDEFADTILERLSIDGCVDGCVGEDQSDTDDDDEKDNNRSSAAHDDTDSTSDDDCEYPNASGAPGESTQGRARIFSRDAQCLHKDGDENRRSNEGGLSEDLARVRFSGSNERMVRLTNDLNKIQDCDCKESKNGITTRVVSL